MDWSALHVIELLLNADEFTELKELWARHNALRQRLSELIINVEYRSSWTRRTPESLRRAAEKLARPRKRRQKSPEAGSRDYPPTITPKRFDRLGRLRVNLRNLEREVAEWVDVRASPDALIYYAELMEEILEREDREKEAEKKRREEENARFCRQYHEREAKQERDPFDVLNLKPDATPEQITARFRLLSKQLHPDTNSGSEVAQGLLIMVLDAMDELRKRGRV
jgi:DnaJ domain